METLQAFQDVVTVWNLLLISAGTIVGIAFGAIPGLNTPIAIAILLPLTFALNPLESMSLLLGTYMGGVSGGLISAILMRIPGTAASVATVFDGYPLTQKGQSADALAVGVFASFFGGIFSAIALMLLTPILAKVAVSFSPWDYFGAVFIALSAAVLLMKGNIIKGFISLMIGLLVNTVGIDPINGIVIRFTGGHPDLDAGFQLIAIVIGVFALPELIKVSGKLREDNLAVDFTGPFFLVPSIKEIKRLMRVMLSSSVIGTLVGILPGMGGGPASLIAYAQAKRSSKTPELFGTGITDGVAATETANNATTGGALIPMLALGVPGDTTTAILIGALTLQGITVGPLLLLTEPAFFNNTILITFIANIFMFLILAVSVKQFSKILSVPRYILLPLIAVFCILGVISINNRSFDLFYMFAFLIIGYLMENNGYPLAPLILGAVLGSMAEQNFRRAIVYYGDFQHCLVQPTVGTVLFFVAILFVAYSLLSEVGFLQRAFRRNR